ncbi:hypothetical protein ACICHK_39975 [Streptomyces sp. AHU1]|uniref:hypothetical protein n=1 Tax=Streptomyces sp. AHU1 TaxID=3377215 RepID=UPI003877DBBB
MRISQLVEELRRVQAEHCDLDVEAYRYGDITPAPVNTSTVRTPKTGPPFVLVEA